MTRTPRDIDDTSGELLPDELLSRDEEQHLAELLRSAWRPSELDPARHAALIELAIEDPLAPASAEEIRESERLRQALDEVERLPESEVERLPESALLARALTHAHRTRDTSALDDQAARRVLERTVGSSRRRAKRGNVIYAVFGVGSGLAVAAAAVLLVVYPVAEQREPHVVAQAPAETRDDETAQHEVARSDEEQPDQAPSEYARQGEAPSEHAAEPAVAAAPAAKQAARTASPARQATPSPRGRAALHERPQGLIASRSSAALFNAKFEPGRASERIDRIAQVRARELRSNRYTQWGLE